MSEYILPREISGLNRGGVLEQFRILGQLYVQRTYTSANKAADHSPPSSAEVKNEWS
jgi:hypothetical protein